MANAKPSVPIPAPAPQPLVRLRVVGIFYEKTFAFAEIPGGKTIKDLLDLAVKNGGLTPASIPPATTPRQSVFSYTATVMAKSMGAGTARVNSLLGFTHNLVAPLNPSLGNKPRNAGMYKLFESTSVENGSVTVHAWQYYVIRGENVFSNYYDGDLARPDVSPADPIASNFPGGKPGFTPFDQVTLLPGDEVVWRNVSIVRNPQTPPIY